MGQIGNLTLPDVEFRQVPRGVMMNVKTPSYGGFAFHLKPDSCRQLATWLQRLGHMEPTGPTIAQLIEAGPLLPLSPEPVPVTPHVVRLVGFDWVRANSGAGSALQLRLAYTRLKAAWDKACAAAIAALRGDPAVIVQLSGQDWRLHAVYDDTEQGPILELVRHVTVPTWNGEGLPPVGTACEYEPKAGDADVWRKGSVVAHARGMAVMLDGNGDHVELVDGHAVRPIRTAEQLAAEAREKAIAEMVQRFAIPGPGQVQWVELFAQMYDAGALKG